MVREMVKIVTMTVPTLYWFDRLGATPALWTDHKGKVVKGRITAAKFSIVGSTGLSQTKFDA
jgi:hypothetical protein